MIVRRLPHLLALALGAGAALLAACGQSTAGGLPAADADALKSQIEDVRQAVDGGRCSDVPGQLGQVDAAVDELPGSTDENLRRALRDGAERLRTVAVEECAADDDDDEPAQTTPTQTETAPTETVPAQTETAPAQTTPTQTAPTETQPSSPPAGPPAQPPAPPPATPGGGATPGGAVTPPGGEG